MTERAKFEEVDGIEFFSAVHRYGVEEYYVSPPSEVCKNETVIEWQNMEGVAAARMTVREEGGEDGGFVVTRYYLNRDLFEGRDKARSLSADEMINYVRGGGEVCPSCYSVETMIRGNMVVREEGLIEVDAACDNCGLDLKEVYKLHHLKD